MWFLIKATFWFTIVLLILPFARPEMAARFDKEPEAQVQVGATLAAASSAIGDLTGICARKPAVCQTGGEALAALGARARDGALIAYQLLNEHFDGDGAPAAKTAAAEPARLMAEAQPASAAAAARPDALTTSTIPVPTPSPRDAAPAGDLAGEAVLPKPYLPPAR